MHMKGNFGAIVLMIVGAGFLAHNLDLIQINVFQLLRVWWPAILILLGIGMFFTKDSHEKQDKQDKN
jgi:Na+/H+ antiporter NhaC